VSIILGDRLLRNNTGSHPYVSAAASAASTGYATSLNISLHTTLFASCSHTVTSRLTQTTHPENLFLCAAGILCSSKAEKRFSPKKNCNICSGGGKSEGNVRGVQLGGGRGSGFFGNLVLIFDGFAWTYKRLFKFLSRHCLFMAGAARYPPSSPQTQKTQEGIADELRCRNVFVICFCC
jgi:hypothetical protein